MTRCLTIFLFACLLAAPIHALQALSNQHSLQSKILEEERSYNVSLPKSYHKGNQRYPVLYLLDGPDNIEHTLATHNLMVKNSLIPEMIIVAIVNTNRLRDFTPAVIFQGEQQQSGGADKFLDFLQLELIPQIEKSYRTQPFKILTGHSLGGLLALHALQTRPKLFQAHFAFSPSLHWGDNSTVARTIAFLKANKDLKNYLYLNLGNENIENMQQGFESLSHYLAQAEFANFNSKSQLYPEEGHMFTPLVGHYQALKSLYADWDLDFANLEPNIFKSIEQHYTKLSEHFGYKIEVNESIINEVGYYYLHFKGDFKTAIRVFQENVKRYPSSPNVYDSLADGLGFDGQIKAAIEQMDKALALVDAKDPRYGQYQYHKTKLLEML